MAIATDDYTQWLLQADIPPSRLTPEVEALLPWVFRFLRSQGADYYSIRLLSHFLLHADTPLKVAQIARLLGISRPNASQQQKLSSKQVIQQAHHRMDGRSHGKLLPRFAGPVAAFLLGNPRATRWDLIDFVERTFGVHVSRVALHKFLKKYGLEQIGAATPTPATPEPVSDATTEPSPEVPPLTQPAPLLVPPVAPVATADPLPLFTLGQPAAPAAVIELARTLSPGQASAPPFCSGGRNTLAPSC